MVKFIEEAIEDLEMMYCTVKRYPAAAEFLFGIELADNMEVDRLTFAIKENNLQILIQDGWIKVPSTHFTSKEELQKLVNCFRLCVSF